MSEITFRKNLRSVVRALWSNLYSISEFEKGMERVIRVELNRAWAEGAADCGIGVDELSEEEIKVRDEFIDNQFSYIRGYAEAIRENDKISKGRLTDLFTRAELWVNRYGEIKNQAKSMACSDKKLEWRINIHCKEHCSSCRRLNGKVKRGSYWTKTIMPRSRDLECGGFRCCCDLVQSDKPLSKGRLSF
jgi:hypothetical protein